MLATTARNMFNSTCVRFELCWLYISLGPNFCAPTPQHSYSLRNCDLESNQFVLSCAGTESLELRHWGDLSNCLELRALLSGRVMWIVAQSRLTLPYECAEPASPLRDSRSKSLASACLESSHHRAAVLLVRSTSSILSSLDRDLSPSGWLHLSVSFSLNCSHTHRLTENCWSHPSRELARPLKGLQQSSSTCVCNHLSLLMSS